MYKNTKLKYLSLSFLVFIFTLGVGVNFVNATLTFDALNIISSGALTLNGAPSSSVTLGSTATSGNIIIGGAQTTGNIILGSTTGNVGIGQTTPTSKLDVTTAGLGVTQTTSSGLALVNTTAATVGAQQISPALRWSSFGWKTDTTAGSQAVDFRSYVVPVQGAANPSGYLTFESSVNGGAYANSVNITSTGNVGIGTTAPAKKLEVAGDLALSNAGSSLFLGGTADNNTVLLAAAPIFHILPWGGRPSNHWGPDPYNQICIGCGSYVAFNVSIPPGSLGVGWNPDMNPATIAASYPFANPYKMTGDVISGTDFLIHIGAVDGGTARLVLGGGEASGAGAINRFKTGQTLYIGETTDTGNLIVRSTGNVGIGTTNPLVKLQVEGRITSTMTSVTVANAATTFAVASNLVKITGDAGGNTVATITGGVSGMQLTLIFIDALVTITDTNAATANTVNLSAAFTSAANTTLTLVHDGNKWFEASRSAN